MLERVTRDKRERTMHHPGNRHSRSGLRFLAAACGAYSLLALISASPAVAKVAQDFVDTAKQYIAKGDLPAALIELRNAARESPQDPTIHVRLAAIYLRLGNNADAEREAKAAGTLGGKESDYLPLQMDATLRQRKFGDLLKDVPAGDRDAALESRVRLGRGLAYLGLRDNNQALANLREAVKLDPASPAAKLALARELMSTNAAQEAEGIVDDVLTKGDAILVVAAGKVFVGAEYFQHRRPLGPAQAHIVRAAVLVLRRVLPERIERVPHRGPVAFGCRVKELLVFRQYRLPVGAGRRRHLRLFFRDKRFQLGCCRRTIQ